VARIVILITIAAGAGWLGYTRLVVSETEKRPVVVPTWPSDDPEVLFSAPGVTEPASRTIQIFSELPGTIGRLYVQSGDRIRKGDLLFELSNEVQAAEVKRCEAHLDRARAELAKLESWDRPEDRQVAQGQWEESKALLEHAEFELRRIEALAASSAASEKEINDARNEVEVCRSRAMAAKARYDRSQAGPRPEELALARAQVAEAESMLETARCHYEKTRVRSPIDGIVIYRFREPGESVFPNVPSPVLSIGNRDVLHVRADVDEADIAKVRIGQKVFATCDAFGDRRFYGKVVEIAQTLGRKNFRTDRPSERADTKILEVVIALDNGQEIPVELQMSVWFLRDESARNASGRSQPSSQPWGATR